MSKRLGTRLGLGMLSALTAVAVLVTPAVAAEDGDGGIAATTCNYGRAQIQLDTSNPGGSVCFETTGTGWIRTDIEKVYGVYNRSSFDVVIAFRLVEGSVFWQETIKAGTVRTLDVDRSRSRVIEMMVGTPSSTSGQGQGVIEDGASVSFYQSGFLSSGTLGFDVFDDKAKLKSVGQNSGFEDRLDASFVVQPGLSDDSCVSFQSAAYPGMYLQAAAASGGGVIRTMNTVANRATWCVTHASSTQVRLQVADGTGRWLENDILGSVTLRTASSNNGLWRLDRGLADPQ
ncbi:MULTISPECIES: AbfB domain-containing protein [Corynebacterium]|nr:MULTISPECIES: AbfB domain-containing protein [Corynebacterium]QJS16983.1 hypothetical protein HK412_12435 [Corynebacterium glutamicum]QXU45506.1 AbfB domain-containing protein [[Brevibacterium] flavum]BAV24458.1 hypothetical protein CGBL_0127670 [Corynebacterium glutamicum]